MASNKKISQLNSTNTAQDSDILPIVQEEETKKITKENLLKEVNEKADQAILDAGEALNTAENAQNTADSAQSDADTALSTAQTAQGAIDDHKGDTNNPHSVTKTQVGLGNVTDDAQVKRSEMGQALGVATLGGDGKIPIGQLNPIAITDVWVVASEVAQLELTAEEGDVAIRTDQSKSYIHNGGTAGTMADWTELLTPPGGNVLSVNGMTGVVTLTTSDITEGTNQYFTNARARGAISGTLNQINYDSETGVLSTPQDIHSGASPTFAGITISSGANNSWMKFVRTSTGTGATDGLGLGYDSVGASFWNYENSPMRWATNGIEKMRLLADGGLVLGGSALDSDVLRGQFIVTDSGFGANRTAFRFVDDYSWTPGNASSFYHTVIDSHLTIDTSNSLGGGYSIKARITNANNGARTQFWGVKTEFSLTGLSKINSIYGFYASAKSGSQAITNAYGVYIEGQKQTGVDNGYSIYATGANDTAYLAHRITANGFYSSNGLFQGVSGYIALQARANNVFYAEPNTTVGATVHYRTKFGRAEGATPEAQVDVDHGTGGVCGGTAPACYTFTTEETCVWSGCGWYEELCQYSNETDCNNADPCSWNAGSGFQCTENGTCPAYNNDESGCVSAGCTYTPISGGECATSGYCSAFTEETDCTNNGCYWNGSACEDPVDCTTLGQGDCEGGYATFCDWTPPTGTCAYGCSALSDEDCQNASSYCTYTPPVDPYCSGSGYSCQGTANSCGSFTTEIICPTPCEWTSLPAVKASNGYQIGTPYADEDVPNNFVFIGSDHSNKLCFKDANGSVNVLY